MQRQHRLGAGGELDLGHVLEGTAQAVPGVIGDAVVEHRGVVAAQLHRAFGAVRMKAVAHQRQHHVGVRQLLHAQGVVHAETAEQRAGQGRVQRWHFQLVGHAAGDAVLPLEVVGIHRLRRAVEGVDDLLELRGGEIHQVQEGALAGAAMRVRGAGAHEDPGRVDAAAGQQVMTGLDQDAPAAGLDAACVHAPAFQADHLVTLD